MAAHAVFPLAPEESLRPEAFLSPALELAALAFGAAHLLGLTGRKEVSSPQRRVAIRAASGAYLRVSPDGALFADATLPDAPASVFCASYGGVALHLKLTLRSALDGRFVSALPSGAGLVSTPSDAARWDVAPCQTGGLRLRTRGRRHLCVESGSAEGRVSTRSDGRLGSASFWLCDPEEEARRVKAFRDACGCDGCGFGDGGVGSGAAEGADDACSPVRAAVAARVAAEAASARAGAEADAAQAAANSAYAHASRAAAAAAMAREEEARAMEAARRSAATSESGSQTREASGDAVADEEQGHASHAQPIDEAAAQVVEPAFQTGDAALEMGARQSLDAEVSSAPPPESPLLHASILGDAPVPPPPPTADGADSTIAPADAVEVAAAAQAESGLSLSDVSDDEGWVPVSGRC